MYNMSSDSDSDSDKDQKAKEQLKLAQIQKTLKKFDAQVIFHSDKSPSDNDFLRYEYDLDLKNIITPENFIQGKTQMMPFTGPLKNLFKLNEPEQTSVEVKNDAQTAEQKILQKQPQVLKTTGTHVVEFPQTAIGYIQVHFQDGTIQRGSGSMVGPNHVLTSARNVIDAKNIKNQIQSIHFWAGLKGKQTTFKEVSVARVVLLDKYKTSPHPSIQRDELDFSILILSEPLGISTGWFGLLSPENFQTIGKNYEVHGYPTTNPEPIQAKVQGHSLKLEEHKEKFFLYDTAAGAGMSGGPIAISRSLTETQSEYYLLGVHLEGRCGLCLSKERFDQIKEIIEFFFLKSSLDESFFGVITARSRLFTVTFENSIGATTKQFHNAIHSLRFAVSLENLTVRSKTEDQAEIVTDETIELLTDALPALRFLNTIRVDLYNANQLTGSNLEEFGVGLAKLKDLNSLQLYFQNGKNLAGKYLTFFFNALCKIENLNSLAVTLINTELVDDDAIKALGTLIYHSQNITLLKLHFQGLPKTTSPAFEQLVGNIKSLPKLQRLNITFFGFTFSDPIKKDLREHYKKLPQLSVM